MTEIPYERLDALERALGGRVAIEAAHQAGQTLVATSDAVAAKVPLSQRGAANGVATLDGSSKLPAGQVPSSVAIVSSANAFTGDNTFTGGTLHTPATGKTFRVTNVAGVPDGTGPAYTTPAGAAGLLVDEYGNIRGGENALIGSGFYDQGSNGAGSIPDFLYSQPNRRIFSRTCYLADVNNPAQLALGRAGASVGGADYPNAGGTAATLEGLGTGVVVGNIFARGWATPTGWVSGNQNGQFYDHRLGAIAFYTAEPQTQTAGGGYIVMGTTPIGSTTTTDRFVIREQGAVGVLGTGFSVSGVDPFALGELAVAASVYARAGGTTSKVQIGEIGPASQGGIKVGTDTTLYRSGANAWTTPSTLNALAFVASPAASGASIISGKVTGDTNPRVDIRNSGGIVLGDGTNQDVSLAYNGTGTGGLKISCTQISFFGGTVRSKQTVTGALSSVTDANAKAVLTSLLSALSLYSLITNSTT